jgi:hypothetical protein
VTERGRGTRGRRVPVTIEVSAAQDGRFAVRCAVINYRRATPPASPASDDSATTAVYEHAPGFGATVEVTIEAVP